MSLAAGFPLDHLWPAGRLAGNCFPAFAFVLILLAWLADRPPLSSLVSLEALNDLGNLLFDVPGHLGVHGLLPVHADLDRQPSRTT